MSKSRSPETVSPRCGWPHAVFAAASLLTAVAVSPVCAQGPTEFSTAYLDGKEFHGISYEADGVTPSWRYQVSFTASTFQYQDIVPPGEGPESGPYVIENGAILIGGEAPIITLLSSTDQHLRVEIDEEGDVQISDWFFAQADAEAVLATAPPLPKAWINIDGDFADWSEVPVITADNNSSPVIDILSVQHATDAQNFYFMITADQDLGTFLPSTDGSGRQRTVQININEHYHIGSQDGINGWFDGPDGASDLASVGGSLQIDGARLEGKVPMALIAGTVPEYLHVSIEFYAWAPDDTADYDEIERLFRVESGGPDGGVDFFGIGKFAYYLQTGPSEPQPAAEYPFEAGVFLEASTPQSVASVSITAPNSAVYPLSRDNEFDTWWETGADYPDQATMDAALPNGTSTFSIQMGNGEVKTAPLNLTGDAYPQPPQLSNYEALQNIDSNETLTLSWGGFAGAGPDDFIVIGIDNPVADEHVFESDFLPGADTSIEIPAGTLQPGGTYEIWIFFAKVVDKDTEAFTEVSGLAIYASETAVPIQTAALSISAGDWRLGAFNLPDGPDFFDATDDILFGVDDWYQIDGPLSVHISEQGEITGDFSMQAELRNYGQLLLFEPGNLADPAGYAILNRSRDVFISPWATEATFAVKIPVSAQQSDFAGTWNFTALTGGTSLTKTVYDENLDAEVTVSGHDMPIAQDGSQHLVDVQLTPLSSAGTLSLTFNASGGGGGETLLWQGDGSLSFSAVGFPLFVNASRDFTFGMGETGNGDEQTLLLGVRAPNNADASWLVGQWRFNWISIDFMRREYLNPGTAQLRWVEGDDDQRRSLAGERLNTAYIGSGVEGELLTISESFAAELGITANGVVDDAGVFYFINASGDIIISASETEWGWEIEMGVKVSDEIRPTRTLTASASGSGSIEAFPSENVGLQPTISAEYIHGETVVLRQEGSGAIFVSWSGDVPAGQEQAEVLVLPMDRDRSITAHFGMGEDPNPWDPTADADSDGLPDLVEQLFANRNPDLADSTSLFQHETTAQGPRLIFTVWDEFNWPWSITHSYDLTPGSWSELPVGVDVQMVPVSTEPPLSQVTVTWPETEEKGFIRVEIYRP